MKGFQVFLLFALGISLGSIGGIFMRFGAKQLPGFSFSVDYFHQMFTNPWVLLSYLLYFIPALIWTYLLTKYSVSFVQPILALTYVLTPILGLFLLGERVPSIRWMGIGIIIIGVFVVSRS